MPNYTITIGGGGGGNSFLLLVNDTALPGLDININIAERGAEIRFKWREMLHLFFREHARQQMLRQKWHLEATLKMAENNKGEKLLLPSDYHPSPPWCVAAEAQIRKEVRRKRLAEAYQGNEEMSWAIASLKHLEQDAVGAAAAGGHCSKKAVTLDAEIPGAGLGERWFGRSNLVQELFLDEWSCLHRIETKIEHLSGGAR
ncbi:hypothetical protein N0V83_009024 [Neocucurbitaria cava]|uniref:Uncharacterized protein n=1 Tax=Neocucurbitaria cava TaxID=798079 RepID=A0A9W8Y049_9PLEO|nr:hypothetical protein N0V83_009024 [Neocucurbitaria cava]